jgi:hypothetical protein
MIEVYVMQMDNDMRILVIFKFVEVIKIKIVFNKLKYHKEEFTVQVEDMIEEEDMIEDTNTRIVVNFKSVEVVGTVIIKEGNIIQLEDTNLESLVPIEIGEVCTTVVIKMEYYTAEIKKKLIVKEGDINMKNMVAIKFLEMGEMKKKLILKEGDINMKNMVVIKVLEMGEIVVNKNEYNTVMQGEITVKEEKRTRKNKVFWSFRNIKTRHSLI